MAITTRGLVFLGATFVAIGTVTISVAGLHLKGQALQDDPKELVDRVWQIIDREYVDPTFNQVDWDAKRTEYVKEGQYKDEEEAYAAIREMLETLEDPYTRFMDPKEFENMQVDTSGELTGVGIQLSQDEETNDLIVVSPIEDTPAAEAGIQAKDTIIEIDGLSTKGMHINDAVQLIRGPIGTPVSLTIRRGETERLVFSILRDRIEIHPVKASVRNDLPGNIGYIRLTQFSANAPSEMRETIEMMEAEDVEGYILDLRSNPGGLLDASVDIARMWLDRGKIVSTVDRRGGSLVREANGKALTNKPLVILVNGGSASASEILSGALQDNDRAVLVGSKTFGKGLVQSVQRLGGGSGLAVTIAKYLTPNGTDIHKEGIVPDIELELDENARQALIEEREKVGTKEDPQYAKALEILQQEIAKHNGLPATSVIEEPVSSPN